MQAQILAPLLRKEKRTETLTAGQQLLFKIKIEFYFKWLTTFILLCLNRIKRSVRKFLLFK